MGNAAGSMDVPPGKEVKTVSAPPGSGPPQKKAASPKLPMPAEEELEERFNAVLVSLIADDTHRAQNKEPVMAHVQFYTLPYRSKQNNTKKQRTLNILKKCTSPGQAYQRAGYIM